VAAEGEEDEVGNILKVVVLACEERQLAVAV
jgi:hypothetical protein